MVSCADDVEDRGVRSAIEAISPWGGLLQRVSIAEGYHDFSADKSLDVHVQLMVLCPWHA